MSTQHWVNGATTPPIYILCRLLRMVCPRDTHHSIPSQHGTFCIKHIILQEFVNLRHSTVVKFRSMRLDTALSLKLAQS